MFDPILNNFIESLEEECSHPDYSVQYKDTTPMHKRTITILKLREPVETQDPIEIFLRIGIREKYIDKILGLEYFIVQHRTHALTELHYSDIVSSNWILDFIRHHCQSESSQNSPTKRSWGLPTRGINSSEKLAPKDIFKKGDKVRVIDGPFDQHEATVEATNFEKNQLTIIVILFKKPTTINVGSKQVVRSDWTPHEPTAYESKQNKSSPMKKKNKHQNHRPLSKNQKKSGNKFLAKIRRSNNFVSTPTIIDTTPTAHDIGNHLQKIAEQKHLEQKKKDELWFKENNKLSGYSNIPAKKEASAETTFVTCSRCQGNGGVNGGCPVCGGKGFN